MKNQTPLFLQGGIIKKQKNKIMPLYPKQEPPYYTEANNVDGTKEYIVLLSQESTNAPTGQPLKNTLGGTVVWTRQGTGQYWGTLTGAFGNLNTTIITGNGATNALITTSATNDKIIINTQTIATAALADDLLYFTTLIVTVYP